MESSGVNLYAEILKTAGMLGIVLGIIIAVLYLVKRFTDSRISKTGRSEIKLISSFYLGNREKLVIVEAENKKLLLGVTQNNISLLKELDEKIENIDESKEEKQDFAKILGRNIIKNKFFFKKEKKSENE